MTKWENDEREFELKLNGNKTFIIYDKENNITKKITIVSYKMLLFTYCSCEHYVKYIFNYKEEQYNISFNNPLDIINYEFELVCNILNKTYWLNDINNEKYETNIIGNTNYNISTKEQNTCFLNGNLLMSYILNDKFTFKNLIDDCF